jgi:hypothetical protein
MGVGFSPVGWVTVTKLAGIGGLLLNPKLKNAIVNLHHVSDTYRMEVLMPSDLRTTDLSVDVSSRIEGLLLLVKEIEGRVTTSPVLTELLRDFHGMAREYILLFETNLQINPVDGRRKWILRHEMLDKLTREWHLVYSLACAVELGSSHLEEFTPYVIQAIEDIGLTNSKETVLLIPVFGESFSLVKVRYSSSNLAILNLPISVIHSPWELSVIWHEMAGLKVFGIRDKIKAFLESYAQENGLEVPEENILTRDNPVTKFMDDVVRENRLENNFKAKIKEFLTLEDKIRDRQTKMWSQDWFEQLYEDACSVFAFGEEFVRVLQTILSRQERKLIADWKHPDLDTRLAVARRLLALRKGNASFPPAPGAETLTDKLLWTFINQAKPDPAAALPVAYSDPLPNDLPEVRRKLIGEMQTFNQNFGNLDAGTINEERFDLGSMSGFAEKASQRYIPETERNSRVRDKLLKIFLDANVDDLLKTPFSPADELSFYDHTANQFPVMYIGGSGHGGHTVLHLRHV